MHKLRIGAYALILTTSFLILAGCKDSSVTFKPIDELKISNDFQYKTIELLQVNHDFGENFSFIPIAVYASEYDQYSENQAVADFFLGYGTTDERGSLQLSVSVPVGFSYYVFKPGYIGLPTDIRIPIETSKSLTAKARNLSYTFATLPKRVLGAPIQLPNTSWWFSNDTYATTGRPDSAITVPISDALLKDMNNSIFRYNREKRTDKDFVDSLAVGTLDFTADADVWLTFIHDSAAFSNTLGFYTYKTEDGRPSEILKEAITIVFPNASYREKNRGALDSGDSVYIGNIEAGTSLGFVIIANGWFPGSGSNPQGRVRDRGYQGIYYSEYAFNPEDAFDDKQHAAIIYHEDENIFLVGMEDNKHTSSSYNFNDVIFAAVVDSGTAIGNKDSIPSIQSDNDNDSDKDGVIDALDAYPEDETRTTLEAVTGTLAFEDLWPKLGDYDFNDLVIGYTYKIDGNKENKIVSMDLTYTILASGAGFPNGLALSLPLSKDAYTITDRRYSKPPASTPNLANRITDFPETDGSRILIFKTQNEVMQHGVKPNPFNTGDNNELEPQSVSYTIELDAPIARNVLGSVPFDVFLLVDNAESDQKPEKANREVHLPHLPPTPLANPDFFNKDDDTTDVNTDRYYKSANNLPWAIHIPGSWDHPLERKSIADAYLYFGAWAESGGSKYADWYLAKPGYRNEKLLYVRE